MPSAVGTLNSLSTTGFPASLFLFTSDSIESTTLSCLATRLPWALGHTCNMWAKLSYWFLQHSQLGSTDGLPLLLLPRVFTRFPLILRALTNSEPVSKELPLQTNSWGFIPPWLARPLPSTLRSSSAFHSLWLSSLPLSLTPLFVLTFSAFSALVLRGSWSKLAFTSGSEDFLRFSKRFAIKIVHCLLNREGQGLPDVPHNKKALVGRLSATLTNSCRPRGPSNQDLSGLSWSCW